MYIQKKDLGKGLDRYSRRAQHHSYYMYTYIYTNIYIYI